MKPDTTFYKELIDNLYDGVYFVDRDRRITYWNRGAERLTGYGADNVTGSRCRDNILCHTNNDGVSLCEKLCPVANTLEDGVCREAEVFFHHRDGHRVPVNVRVSPIRNGDGMIVGAVEVFSDNSARVSDLQRIDELQQLVFLDPLTGVANRRYIQMYLQSKFDEMFRYGWPFGIMLLDLDHFKEINDSFGHQMGDDLLKMAARTLRNAVRSYDLIGRWGGEEFIAIITNVKEKRLCEMAERLRRLVEESSMAIDDDIARVTVSIGATLATSDDTVGSLLKRTDELLYRSKGAGRNCVTCA
ncbi:GGDEF domain-containing protein [Geobacter sulfurreducens]|uniref:sensor domain-containing diguanylate cyclase n=1 Tax=Geobacter sulfurreducens TaxID=35554 RepID=UPI000DBB5F6B|nr:GGDEF domain-containing protein [Geobacter sulfurreducens]BBA69899.1 Response regulator PleD [Geobacter sulfurreducens]